MRMPVCRFFLILSCLAAPAARAAQLAAPEASSPVHFAAASLTHDDRAQTVIATGDVELVQGPRILHADKMVYDLARDKVTAIGNVSMLDEKGNVHFAEYAELSNAAKDGFVQGLLSLLADGSRFSAVQAKREKGGRITRMTEATYTACKVCERNPKPLWQIKADQVVHNAETKSIDYTNARLEFAGVPLAWSPVFSHPDPTQKQKSGFLRPQYGWTRLLGAHFKGGYYYAVAPDKDATLQLMPTAQAGTLLEGEWRQRFERGRLQINASTASSDRKEEDGRVETGIQRGSLFVNGNFDLSDTWRTGFDMARASDKQYLRLYDISQDNVLTSEAYAERFAGRDYSRVSAFTFQDVRLGLRPDQPDILPMAEHHVVGAPGSLLGGRAEATFAALGVQRQGNSQSVQRGSLVTGWERRDATPFGLATVMRLSGRGDVYAVQDSDAAKTDPSKPSSPSTARGLATGTLLSSYPLVRRLDAAQAVIEPMAGVSLSPKVNGHNDRIPNEDSIDVRFDNSNLFSENRYPGVDRQEDGGRFNYGLKTSLHGDEGRSAKVFLGQSYRFYGDKIFPRGSGLDQRLSDFVGQTKLMLSPAFDLDYRFQLDNNTLAIRRHEVQAGGGNDRFRANARYFFTSAVAGTGFAESRQQVQSDLLLRLTKDWSFSAAALADVGDEPGLRNASTGLTYADECFVFALEGARTIATDASGDNDTKILLRIGLRTIGEFASPKLSLNSNAGKK